MPVIVDIDLKILLKDDNSLLTKLYSEDQVIQIVEIYQSVLRNIIQDCTDSQLLCVVLEKKPYKITSNSNVYVKNGFHLHFPSIFLSKPEQKVHLIPRVKKIVSELNIFENLGYKDSGSVIDAGILIVPWLLYGSKKSENMEAYKVSYVLNSSLEKVDLETAFQNYSIFDDNEEKIDIQGNVEYFLPRILSVFPYGRETHELKSGLKYILDTTTIIDNKKIASAKYDPRNLSLEKSLEIAEALLPMLSDKRAEDRMDWLTVGWILFNIGEGTQRALDLWLNFSSRCEEKYDETTCIYEWNRMTVRSYTLNSLYYYAKVDSPNAYKEYKKSETSEYIAKSIEGGHHDIANILYSEYGTEFVCSSFASKSWYRFIGHRWEEIEEGVDMINIIAEKLPLRFEEKSRELYAALARATDKSEIATITSQQKAVLKTVVNLKSSPFIGNIMKASAAVFYNKLFKEKLDQNPYMIGFQNGVYDLKLNIFRDGRPEDYINKVLPINYIEYKETDKSVQDVIDFFDKVFPDKDVRDYFFNIYCDVFVGGNPEKIILFWTGAGDNGKSVTQRLFEKMLGQLAIKFETTLFTGKKTQTGSANPDLARAGPPVRMATMEEPDNDEQMNIGYLKKLSGDDTFWARDLFEKGKSVREVEAMFIITIIANKLPALKHADTATFNRVKVIPFEAKFVKSGDACPDTLEEQIKQKRFPRDKHFRDKVPDMLPALAWYLLNWRKNHKPASILEPQKVQEATANYQRQNDMYREFINERIIEDTAHISATEIYNDFKIWYRDSYPNHTLPVKKDVVTYFTSLWGTPLAGGKWKGYRFRTDVDDIQDGKIIVLNDTDLDNIEQGTFVPM